MKIDLSQILKRQGLTQIGAARKTGISENTIGKLCNSQRSIRVETVRKLCAGLGITPNDLFGIGAPPTIADDQFNHPAKDD